MTTRTQRIAQHCTTILMLLDRRPPGYEASRPSLHDLHYTANALLVGAAMNSPQPNHELRAEIREAEATVRDQLQAEATARWIDGDTPWMRRQAV